VPYIIDGHNLIGQLQGFSLSEIDDEQRLIEALLEFSRIENRTIEVFFDNAPPGVPRARKHGRITAFFSRADRSADQAIYERLKKLGKEARNWTVVSSDRQVQAAAKAVGAKTISSSEFARQLTSKTLRSKGGSPKSSEKEERLPPDEIDRWIEIFGGDLPEKPI